MRTHLTLGLLASTATTALVGLGALGTAPAHALADGTAGAASTVRERGVVIECTGRHAGNDLWLSVYENNRHANVFQVVLSEGDGRSIEDPDGFWDGRTVDARMRMHGKRVAVQGDAVKVGKRSKVREEIDDAGQHVVSKGVHRDLRTDLELTYGKATVKLTCGTAFAYDLKVTKTPIV